MSMIKFAYLSKAKYDLITTKDASTLYYLSDTLEVYKGTDLYNGGVKLVTDFPTTPAQGVIYVSTTTGEGKVHNGTAWTQVIRPVDTTVTSGSTNLVTSGAVYTAINTAVGGIDFTDYVTGVTWNGTTAKLTIAKGDSSSDITITKVATDLAYDGATGTISIKDTAGTVLASAIIPLDNFVSSGLYDAESENLVLTMQNGDTVSIPASALVDIYYGGSTTTTTTSIETINDRETIKVAVKISESANNAITTQADGLHVDISGKLNVISSGTSGNFVKVAANGQVADSGYIAGGATLDASPSENTLATEAAVAAIRDAAVQKTAIKTVLTGADTADTDVASVSSVVNALSWTTYED